MTRTLCYAEITHNIFGAHDAEFYKLMDELWEVRVLLSCCHSASGGPQPTRLTSESGTLLKSATVCDCAGRRWKT